MNVEQQRRRGPEGSELFYCTTTNSFAEHLKIAFSLETIANPSGGWMDSGCWLRLRNLICPRIHL